MNQLPYLKYKLFISDLKMKIRSPVYETQAANGKQRVSSRNFSYHEGAFTYAALDNESCKLADAFFLTNNKSKSFLVSFPEYDAPCKPIQGTPTVQGNFPAGADTIKVEGFTGQITAGDKLTIANDSKVYTALNTITETGFLTLYPSLRKDVSSSTPINFNPLFKIRMKDDVFEYKPSARYARLYDIQFREDLD